MVLNLSQPFLRDFLKIIQKDFPLDSRPFLKIAQKLKITEEEVLRLLEELTKQKYLRQISAIFNPSFFGHSSALFAFKVLEKNLLKAIEIINAHPGITHNYLRNHPYNLWFTLVVLPGQKILEVASKLFLLSEAEDFLYLPVIKTFKISTVLEVETENFEIKEDLTEGVSNFTFTEEDIKLVKVLQEPLPLVKTPFASLSQACGLSEKKIFSWLKGMDQLKALRRFGALLNHKYLGYTKNIMVLWEVPEEKTYEIGKKLSQENFITHCYERKTYPHWKYNLYTMCHFKTEEEKKIISVLAKKFKIENYLMLETLKEFKKERLKLFYET
ncbi:MAG: hypothetical protein NZ530_02225 [Thermodesulfobacteriaceae bacterium]|nr:hypothetical protein [Thermodesulfobacteriaceae bacterium]MCX8041120.1 hypothetical protein [Thermodesulfobacteriaceae bacterium]MDW8135841.1 hypothetical protein [Thermodesulfobacterium sp.]